MYDSTAPHSHATEEESSPLESLTLFDVSLSGLKGSPDPSGSATGEDVSDVTEASVCRDGDEDWEWEEPDTTEEAIAPDEDAVPVSEGSAGRDDVSAPSEESLSTPDAPRGAASDHPDRIAEERPADSPTPSGKPMPELPTRGAIAQLGVRRPGVAPKRIGRGRLVPARLTWKPGDPFAASVGRRREPFRWEVMLTAASVTAACGLGCIWLLRTILA